MSADSDTQAVAQEAPAAAPAPNPLVLGLMTFLPGALTLGLWFVGYLDTATLGGGMIPIVLISSGLFELIACVWATRIGATTVAAAFGLFSAFWISFGVLLIGLTSGWWGITTPEAGASVQSTYLLSFLIAVVVFTLGTLRLPIMFTVGFALIALTFALAFLGVSTGSAGLFPIAGIVTFLFCAVFAYILLDGFRQDLGGSPLPMGSPLVK
ncbi:MAG: acetate uptake transporter family protein [Pseudonocardia sp.]|nr:acetate uptake transporter family protein [Pseudonocardia sp.]